MSNLLTLKQVAVRLNMAYVTVYGYVREGKIPAIQFKQSYRVKEEDLEKYINDNRYSS